jgi:hypothetical protein
MISITVRESAAAGLHRGQFFGIVQTHRLERVKAMPLSCKSDGLLWLDLFL